MALFKSRRERELDREVAVRRGIHHIRRTIRELERAQEQYVAQARRAKQIGDQAQLGFLRQTIKRTMRQRLLMERQLLSIETARQLKKQAEAHARFAEALIAIGKSMGEFLGGIDLERTQRSFEKALEGARTWEERMNVFLDMVSEQAVSDTEAAAGEEVSDEEIEELIEAGGTEVQTADIDEKIKKALDEIRNELGEA